MKLNKPLIRKMIKRIESMPESYNQNTYCRHVEDKSDLTDKRPLPVCGTMACLAGEALIVSAPTVAKGIRLLSRTDEGKWVHTSDISAPVGRLAMKKMGLTIEQAEILFWTHPVRWPKPFASRFESVKTYKAKAKVAVDLLKAILKTDGKILEEA